MRNLVIDGFCFVLYAKGEFSFNWMANLTYSRKYHPTLNFIMAICFGYGHHLLPNT